MHPLDPVFTAAADEAATRARGARPVDRPGAVLRSHLVELIEVLQGACLLCWDTGLLCVLSTLCTKPPEGRTLRERYPPAPGAFVTHYSSVELTEEAFAPAARVWPRGPHNPEAQ